tara:strand:- start:3905 stop:4729 length:825 start_codon:yes stop_codon:yes gene_type:complete
MNTKNIDIYWDFENVRIPNKTKKINTITIINTIREKLKSFGIIRKRNIYIDSQSPTERNTQRGELNLSGWSIIDCPHRGKKETIDKKIISDILWSIIHERNAKNLMICIITSDTDFSQDMSKLRDIGVYTCLIYSTHTTEMLIDSSDLSIDWHKDILKTQNIQYDKPKIKEIKEITEVNMIKSINSKSNMKIQEQYKKEPIKLQEYDMTYLLEIIKRKCNEMNKVRIDVIGNTWYSKTDKRDRHKLRFKLNSLIKSGVNSGTFKKNKEYLILSD